MTRDTTRKISNEIRRGTDSFASRHTVTRPESNVAFTGDGCNVGTSRLSSFAFFEIM